MSSKPSDIRWQIVVSCCTINFLFCLAMFRSNVVPDITDCIFEKIRGCSLLARSGTQFLFGHLVLETKLLTNSSQNDDGIVWHDWRSAYSKYSPILFFRSLIILYFTNFVFAILRYYKVVDWTVKKLGTFSEFVVGTSGSESAFSVVRIFLDPAASVLSVKDFLPDFTTSEINTIVTVALSGTASVDVAHEVTAFWRNEESQEGKMMSLHLQLSSVMSVLSAVAVSKLILPEVKGSGNEGHNRSDSKREPLETPCNGFDFVVRSVSDTTTVLVNVIGCVIACMSFVTFCDAIIHWAGTLFGHQSLCFAELGELFLPPVLWLIGISWEQTHTVAKLVSYKMSHNELSALAILSEMPQTELSRRNSILAAYLINNFVHPVGLATTLASITSALASLGNVAQRRVTFRCLARSIFGAIFSTFLTTAIVGTLLE